MAQDAVSFHALDWDAYSPDPSSDLATDSTRWRMTALPGFDAPIVGGVNGSFFNLNFGAEALDARSSVTYTVAYLYGTSLDGLRAASDAAVNRYNLSVAVEQAPPAIPQAYALQQNYPNPFNPKTVVRSQLPVASWVKLVVYDLLGREVTIWGMKNDSGRPGVIWTPSMAQGLPAASTSAGSRRDHLSRQPR